LVNTERLDSLKTLIQSRQKTWGPRRGEYHRRRGVKRHHRREGVVLLRVGNHLSDYGLMSAVKSIKDANGDDARFGFKRLELAVAKNVHASNLPALIGFFDR
jgi:hypothetical protein